MNDNNPAPAIPAPVAEVKPTAVFNINDKVAAVISGSNPKVIDTVVNQLADRETTKRATALLDGVEAANRTRNELNKIGRGDVKPSFDANGKPVGEATYSEARLKEIKKTKEKLGKIESAIEKATFEKPDWNPLFNLKSLLEQADKAIAPESVE